MEENKKSDTTVNNEEIVKAVSDGVAIAVKNVTEKQNELLSKLCS